MNTATNRFSAVFVSFLAVLFMTLWSVPAAWAFTGDYASDKESCIANGGTFVEYRVISTGKLTGYECEQAGGSEYDCDASGDTITCGWLAVRTQSQSRMQSGASAIPLTPAQKERRIAQRKAGLAQGTIKQVTTKPTTTKPVPISPKDPFPAASQPTPKAGMTQPMTKPAITQPQQPGEPMPKGPGRPGEPMKTLPSMNTAPVKK